MEIITSLENKKIKYINKLKNKITFVWRKTS